MRIRTNLEAKGSVYSAHLKAPQPTHEGLKTQKIPQKRPFMLSLIRAEHSLIRAEGSLIQAGGSLIQARGSLIQAGGSLIQAGGSLIQAKDSLIRGKGSLIQGKHSLVQREDSFVRINYLFTLPYRAEKNRSGAKF